MNENDLVNVMIARDAASYAYTYLNRNIAELASIFPADSDVLVIASKATYELHRLFLALEKLSNSPENA